jgi:hypothetical protein
LATDPEALDRIIDDLVSLMEKRQPAFVISGMAEGFDEAIAKAAIRSHIPFWAYVSNPTYGAYYWGRNSVTGRDRLDEFNDLESQAAYRQFSVLKGIYVPGTNYHSNFKRNEDMVDDSEELWFLDTGSPDGGTAHCVNYAANNERALVAISWFT